MSVKPFLVFFLLSTALFSQNSSKSATVLLNCETDTLFCPVEEIKEYNRLDFDLEPALSSDFSNGLTKSCVLPSWLEKFSNLDSLVVKNAIALPDQLDKLPHLSFLSASSSYYFPKLPALRSINFSFEGDSLPENLLASKGLEEFSFYCTGNKSIGFDDYREQYILASFNWYRYLDSVSAFRSLRNLKIDRYFDLQRFVTDTMTVFPKRFYELKHLSRLDLQVPIIDSISSLIGQLTDLEYLRIRFNKQLPVEISKLVKLDTIIATAAPIFPDAEISLPSLRYLDCAGPYIPVMPKLSYLKFNADSLPQSILESKTVDSLYMSITHYNSDSLVRNKFIDVMRTCSKLRSLQVLSVTAYMLYKPLTNEMVSLAPLFAGMTKLKTLRFYGRKVTEADMKKVKEAYEKYNIKAEFYSY